MIPTNVLGKIGRLIRLGRTYPNQLVKRASSLNVKKMEET